MPLPKITFDRSAAPFILEAFDYCVHEDFPHAIMDKDLNPVGCCCCGSPLNLNDFAGVIFKKGLLCDNIFCLIALASTLREEG